MPIAEDWDVDVVVDGFARDTFAKVKRVEPVGNERVSDRV